VYQTNRVGIIRQKIISGVRGERKKKNTGGLPQKFTGTSNWGNLPARVDVISKEENWDCQGVSIFQHGLTWEVKRK